MLRRGAALALTAVLTAGCGGLSQTRLLGSDDGNALTTLGFGLVDEIASTRVDVYRKSHPDVDLQVNEGAFDAQQFLSAVASGRPPDLVYIDREMLGSYAHRGALEPLTNCRADLSQYRKGAVDQVTVDGTLYGIPEFTILPMVLVNTKALGEAGASLSDVDTSDWAGLKALGEKMTKKDGGKLTRLGFYPKIPDFYPMWIKADGGAMLSDDGRKAQLDSKPAQAALSYAKSVYDELGGYPVVKSFNDSWDFFGEKNEFATDKVGIMLMENWYLNTLAEVSPNAPIAVLPFTDTKGKPLSWATGSSWAIPKGAAHYDQACEFIKTVTGVPAWVAAAQARVKLRAEKKLPFTGLYTANTKADDEIFRNVYKPSGNRWVDDAVKVVLSLQDAAFATPPSPAGAEVQNEWQAATGRVLLNGDDVGSTLRSAQKQAQAAIDRTNQ